MKLRQKLAVALASAMVLTAVPVVTMADANVSIKKTQSVVKKDEYTTGAALKIEFKDHDDATDEIFYMTFENAEWNKDAVAAGINGVVKVSDDEYTDATGNIVVEKQQDKVFKVTVKDAAIQADPDKKVVVPIVAKLTGGTATVTVDAKGAPNSTLPSKAQTFEFASTGEKEAKVKVGDKNNFYKKGKLADITFVDDFVNSINKPDSDDNTFTIELEVDDSDYEFYDIDNIEIEGTYGYGKFGKKKVSEVAAIKAEIDPDHSTNKDKGILRITIPAGTLGTADSVGEITLKNVWVKTNEKDPEEGDFVVKVSGKNGTDLLDDGDKVVGKVVKYSHYITMNDEKVVDIKAGRQEDVKFKVGEYLDDCFVAGRDVEITLDNPDTYFILEDFAKECAKNEDNHHVFTYKDEKSMVEKLITDSDQDRNMTVKSVQFEWDDDYEPTDVYDKSGNKKTGSDVKDYTRCTKIIVTLSDESKTENGVQKNINTNGEDDWFKVETKVYVPIDQKDKGTIKLKAEGRGLAEAVEQEAIKIGNPFDVTIEPTTLKVGLQSQVGGKITLKETDKAQFEKGQLKLNVVKDSGKKQGGGISIDDKGEFSVTAGDLKKAEDFDTKGDQSLKLEFKRQSKAAATLEFKDPSITVDRSVPEGKYSLELSGDAIDKYDGTLTVDDFIIIGTGNTQDLVSSNGLVKGTAKFVIGESKYTAIDGKEVTMDAASYIQNPGYTMVPVKYVALAFGITEDCISYANGNIAIVTGNKAIGLKRGSNIATVNGVQVPLSTKVTIKDGRTYAPIADVAKILGITPSWDSSSKTASFTNN